MQVTKHIHAIKIPFQIPIAPGNTVDRFVYAYLIYGKKIYLIDTGIASSKQIIFDYIIETGRKIEEISMIILTHSHPDHIGAARAIQKETGCGVMAHADEKSWIEDVGLQSRERPVPNFHSLVDGSVRIDRILEEGDIIDLGDGLSLEVFHTPGHSIGSISLFLREDKALFTGDAIPLAGDLPIYDDVLASVDSIKKLKLIDGIDLLLASWDDPQRGESVYQRMYEALRYLQRVHEAVASVAGDGSSLEPSEFCCAVLEELGIPAITANPLVVRSFAANLKIIDRPDLLRDPSI
jgi:hydroxyacylglutathione hydrolase